MKIFSEIVPIRKMLKQKDLSLKEKEKLFSSISKNRKIK